MLQYYNDFHTTLLGTFPKDLASWLELDIVEWYKENLLGFVLQMLKQLASKWDRVSKMSPKLGISELTNGSSIVRYLDDQISNLLDIYERVSSNGVALTFLMSALWHGFYPGYYMSFFTASIVVTFARSKLI